MLSSLSLIFFLVKLDLIPIPRLFISARESVFATKLTWQVNEDSI